MTTEVRLAGCLDCSVGHNGKDANQSIQMCQSLYLLYIGSYIPNGVCVFSRLLCVSCVCTVVVVAVAGFFLYSFIAFVHSRIKLYTATYLSSLKYIDASIADT